MRSEISRLLKQRGHEVTKEGSDQDIFVPIRQDLEPELVSSFKTVLYNLMRHDSFRRALRDWAYGRISESNQNLKYIESYVQLCERFGGWNNGAEAIQLRYATTFEWYVSELLSREFSARASGFGLRMKDADPGDEFDCIGLLDKGLTFVECKTGREGIYSQISKFIRRDAELGATYSFFVFDRDYTFVRTGDDIPQLSADQAYALGVQSIEKVIVGSHTFFQVQGLPVFRRGWRYFLVCSAFNGFEDRIRYMIRYVDQRQEAGPVSSLFKVEAIPFAPEASQGPSAQANQIGSVAEQAAPAPGTGPPAPEAS